MCSGYCRGRIMKNAFMAGAMLAYEVLGDYLDSYYEDGNGIRNFREEMEHKFMLWDWERRHKNTKKKYENQSH